MSVDYMAGTTLDYFVLKNERKRMHVMRQSSFSPLCVSAVLDIPIVDCDVLEAAKKNIQPFASVSPVSYKPADTADINPRVSLHLLNEEIVLVGGPQI